ncbi:MAG: hypothetical protein ACM3VZ_06530 [Acidobacteriota bacterium]
MKRAPTLAVVRSAIAPRQPQVAPAPVSLIVSTEPALFASHLQDHVGQTVFLFEHGDAALHKLHEAADRVRVFVADFRALDDRWTGQKFLKYIRDRREFDAVKVYLMADQWQAPQEQWIIKCGAEGFIKRQPDPVVAAALGQRLRKVMQAHEAGSQDSITTAAGDPWMEAVNQVFKRFAGALGARLLTMQALEAMESRGQGDRHFYVADLSSRLMNPGRRSEFLLALEQAGLMD